MNIIGEKINNRYEVTGKICGDFLSDLWSARDLDSGAEVSLRFLKKENSSYRIEDLLRFKRETQAVSELEHPDILGIYKIDEYNNYTFITGEPVTGEQLCKYMEKFGRLTLDSALKIMVGLCGVLKFLHLKGFVYGDLNPQKIFANILEGGIKDVKIYGPGLAELMELTDIKEPGDIIKTFGYMSPEATGMISKRVDERSDLYSAGIIFYRLLTGKLPFSGDTIDSILHMHIAVLPGPPSQENPDIPGILDSVILKLLSKDQEERYQSAGGLLADLMKILEGSRDFELASDDHMLRLSFKPGLVGRERELESLKEFYRRASGGRGGICFIAGEAGRGKTRLVEEIRNYMFDAGGIFLSAKCFAGENKMPYQIFHDLLKGYREYFNRLDDAARERERKKILENLGDLGEIIISLNPVMRDIIGEARSLVRLEPVRENERFLDVSSDFFCSIGCPGNPVVLFLDDMQWVDEGSLSLLSIIAYKVGDAPLLVLAAYRDDELPEEHTLNKMKIDFPEIHEMELGLFDKKEITDFVCKILGIKEMNIPDIFVNYLLESSKGNPFFAMEIIRQFLYEKIIYQDVDRWEINLREIEYSEIPDSIIDIVLRRIRRLSEEEMEFLAYASVIGSKFNLDLLYKLTGCTHEQLVNIIDRALELQLVERQAPHKNHFVFVHDRLRDVFYQEIDNKEKQAIHLKIARVLEDENKTEDLIFSLVHHYTVAGDYKKSLEYSIPAGDISKERYAYDEAVGYYKLALIIMESEGLLKSPKAVDVKKNLGEVFLTSGNYDEAIEIFNNILPSMKTELEEAEIFNHICFAYFKKGDFRNCEIYANKGLEFLGEGIPKKRIFLIFSIVKEFFIHFLHNFFPGIFVLKKPGKHSARFRFMSKAILPAVWLYALSDVSKFLVISLKVLNSAENKMGRSMELAMATCGYASILMAVPSFNRSLVYHKKSLRMREDLNDQWGVAQSLQLMGFCYEWMGDYRKSFEFNKRSMNKFKKIGDIRELGVSTMGIVSSLLQSSRYEQMKYYNSQFYDIANRTKDNMGIALSWSYSAVALFETGDYAEALNYGKKLLSFSRENEFHFISCIANIVLGQASLETGRIGEAISYLENAKGLFEKNNFLKNYTVYLYCALTEAYLRDYEVKTRGGKINKIGLKKIRNTCKDALRKVKPWAAYYGYALAVNARFYDLAGKRRKAEKLFIESIEHNKKYERSYYLAKSYFHYGQFLKNTGNDEFARTNWQKAYSIFEEIKSKSYLARTSDLLGINNTGDTSIDRFIDKRRLSSVITVSQQISSILNIEELLENIVAKAIEVTGAMSGYLFIINENSGELELKASRNIEQTGEVAGFRYSREIVDDVFESGNIVITNDAASDPVFGKFRDLRGKDLKSILCFPILLHERRIGVFYLGNPLSSSVFNEDDIELLNVFFSQAAISIENAGLYSNLERRVDERTKQLRDAQEQLAQMAEVATGVLHNIGNILNSVTISNEEIQNILHSTKLSGLEKANQLLRENLPEIENFIEKDQRGKLLPEYYFKIEEMLEKEHSRLEIEAKDLAMKIVMMRDIIVTQQSYARVGINYEEVKISDIIEDALKILSGSLLKYEVRINKKYSDSLRMKMLKSRLNHVLLNILKNAYESMADNENGNRILDIETGRQGDRYYIKISDNGRGIDNENLENIFSYGFTTKEGGHGFGLHTCKKFIEEMGGQIEVKSNGLGTGATFILNIPINIEPGNSIL